MPEAKEALMEWIIEHVKSKDILTKQITAIKQQEQDADVVVEGVLKHQFIFIQPLLSDLSRLGQLKEKHVILVTANTKDNLEFVIAHWPELVEYPHLCLYFVNPKSALDTRWMLFPAAHDRITEREVLRKGLESLFATVEPWRE